MESEPILTARKNPLYRIKLSSEEDRTHNAVSSRTASPTHYQRAIPASSCLSSINYLRSAVVQICCLLGVLSSMCIALRCAVFQVVSQVGCLPGVLTARFLVFQMGCSPSVCHSGSSEGRCVSGGLSARCAGSKIRCLPGVSSPRFVAFKVCCPLSSGCVVYQI